MENPVIVIVGYNRPHSLRRLLYSLDQAIFDQENITLVFSLDYSENQEVLQIAQKYEWKCGSKKIINHRKHLGLKRHMLSCGDLTQQYDGIILLEDDLFVSPYFYKYAAEALEFYNGDPKIAGISLYAYHKMEVTTETEERDFTPISNGFDTFFMQCPSSWGVVWSKEQWSDFSRWHKITHVRTDVQIPEYTSNWGKESWKKIFYKYLIETDRFFVFPYLSLSTNFEDPGVNADTAGHFQVHLLSGVKNFSFCDFDHSTVKYDAWFEPRPEMINAYVLGLQHYDYEVDLLRSKSHISKKWILTTERGSSPIMQWSDRMRPLAQNLVYNLAGNGIALHQVHDIKKLVKDSSSAIAPFQEKGSKQISIGVVIPVVSFQNDLLNLSLQSLMLLTYHNLSILLICAQEAYDEVKIFLAKYVYAQDLDCKVTTEKTADVFKLAFDGLCLLQSKLRFWIKPGTTLQNSSLHLVNKVFHEFPLTSVVVNLSKNNDIHRKRFNYPLFCENVRKSKTFLSTESMVFRSSVVDALKNEFIFTRGVIYHARVLASVVARHWIYPVELGLCTNPDIVVLTKDEIRMMDLVETGFGFILSAYLFRVLAKIGHKYAQGMIALVFDLPPIYRYDSEQATFYQSSY